MNCRQVYLYICDNLDADLHSRRCRLIRKHIASCPDCSAYLASMKQTIALYRLTPPPRVPGALHRDVMRAIESTRTTQNRDRASKRR